MSTKFTKEQIDIAERELKKNSRKFKQSKRRITKQVRISDSVHSKIKKLAKEEKKTISKLLDRLLV